ncbi:MAG: hypothetical protein ACR2P3_00360 [Geminicoccaceae bacterium]
MDNEPLRYLFGFASDQTELIAMLGSMHDATNLLRHQPLALLDFRECIIGSLAYPPSSIATLL